jgi:hypothetical protein
MWTRWICCEDASLRRGITRLPSAFANVGFHGKPILKAIADNVWH